MCIYYDEYTNVSKIHMPLLISVITGVPVNQWNSSCLKFVIELLKNKTRKAPILSQLLLRYNILFL